jgi:hypothetical protein
MTTELPGSTANVVPPTSETTPLTTTTVTKRSPAPQRHLLGRHFSRFLATVIPDYGIHGSFEEAWDYFETIVLPRRRIDGKGKAPVGAPPSSTTLYSAWFTPQRELSDFGTGIAVYFSTLRALMMICLVAFLLYLPSIRYYQSDKYGEDRQASIPNDALRGSMLCTATEWVPCPTCIESDWEPDRIAHDTTTSSLTFILRNACAPLRWQEGVNHLVVLVFLICAVLGLGYHQVNLEQQYDEDVLTASDFSVVVNNPPPDATDPEGASGWWCLSHVYCDKRLTVHCQLVTLSSFPCLRRMENILSAIW